MAKFHGVIGYVSSEETAPGVWEDSIKEYTYYGDIVRNTRRWETGQNLNDNLNISNQFNVVGDWANYDNFSTMKYITYMGKKWKITSVEIQRPRLLITVGGLYND